MKSLKILTSAFFIGLSLLLTAGKVQASEGTVELTGTTDARCFASSILTKNFQYKVIISCQNLIYPAGEGKFAYILWSVPNSGGSLKLGALSVGKAEFTTKSAYSQLFVTAESNTKVRNPSNDVIMRGSVQPIPLLTSGQAQVPETQVTSPEATGPAENFGEILEEAEPIPAPAVEESTAGILGFLRKGGVVLAVGIFVILLILAILTRARG